MVIQGGANAAGGAVLEGAAGAVPCLSPRLRALADRLPEVATQVAGDGERGVLSAFDPLVEVDGGGLGTDAILDLVVGWSRQVAAAQARVREWAAVLARQGGVRFNFRPDIAHDAMVETIA
ncbi:MAG TPA: hypothetical protein DHV14_14640, partial [Micrococcales bacterium]|nr:hypothetical protein [Micrococcales bacterium]